MRRMKEKKKLESQEKCKVQKKIKTDHKERKIVGHDLFL